MSRAERQNRNATAVSPLPVRQRSCRKAALDRRMRRRGEESRWWWLVPTLYIIFLLLPIYWLVNMSFKTNAEIVSSLTLYPHDADARQLHRSSSPTRPGTRATSTRSSMW